MIARTLFDLLKVAAATALAGKFFFEFPTVVQLIVWVGIPGMTVVAIFVCPPKKP